MSQLSPEDIAHYGQMLDIHRDNLAGYLIQRALLGAAYSTPQVNNGIKEARKHIRIIKALLRSHNVTVADHPNDEEQRTPTAPSEKIYRGKQSSKNSTPALPNKRRRRSIFKYLGSSRSAKINRTKFYKGVRSYINFVVAILAISGLLLFLSFVRNVTSRTSLPSELVPSPQAVTAEIQSGTTLLPITELVKYPEYSVVNEGHGINVRAEPSDSAKAVFFLPDETVVMQMNSLNEGWEFIRLTDGRQGWVEGKYLTPR